VGEAALAAGELTFGDAVNGTVSHEPNDVLYIAFRGQDAVPGKNGASWAAGSKEAFAASIHDQCMALVARIQPQTNNNGDGGGGSGPGSGGDDGECSWKGHCEGQ
jgi:hypothetical protein